MGEVVRLSEARARRSARARLAASLIPLHPALRWATGTDGYGHRRADTGAACGVTGPLRLAPADAQPCPACYPDAP